ncbi:hypothetical protein B0I35DRAFT_474900 [Stachybotrys elegans]|uniref:FHA domain-containing protein n=1 Tax=Stachybotrys elegans TaxID=80388 RepID=A0A8K0WWU3_9HYPO|nr:hypothetical protein B0I35DRAFT_474900 [Stachybotrys elegans]
MPIGRTSKRNASLAASEGNCWFDSPVMSREHAGFHFDAAARSVTIQDNGSLHGTYYNNAILEANQRQELRNGDILRFGIPIDREQKTFHPCVLDVQLEYTSSGHEDQTSTKVFRVPDDSDVEICDDDIEVQYTADALRKHGIKPVQNSPEKTIAIDLTITEEVPVSALRETLGPAQPIQDLTLSSNEALVVDLTSSPSPSPSPEYAGLSYMSQDECLDACDTDEEEDSMDAELHPPSQLEPGREPSCIASKPPSEWVSSFTGSSGCDDCDNDSLSDDHPPNSQPGSQDSDESEASAEGPLFIEEDDEFDGLDEFEDGTQESEDLEEPESDMVVEEGDYQPWQPPQTVSDVPSQPSHGIIVGHNNAHLPTVDNFDSTQLPPLEMHNGSASHLATDKEQPRLPSIYESIVQENFRTAQSQTFVELMGAKTGKIDYFAAREGNKETAQLPASVSHDLGYGAKAVDVYGDQRPLEEWVAAPYDQEQPRSEDRADMEYDEESAYQFHLSKQARAAQKQTATIETESTKRTHVEISDLVDISNASNVSVCGCGEGGTSPVEEVVEQPSLNSSSETCLPSGALKRKAADISRLTPEEEEEEEEAEAEAKAEASDVPMTLSPDTDSPSLPAAPALSDSAVISKDPESQRSIIRRRMRRVAEVVGIAAFGGAAVMGALIATAPVL